MKTIKFLFAIVSVIILCPFIWSWTVIPGSQTTSHSIASKFRSIPKLDRISANKLTDISID